MLRLALPTTLTGAILIAGLSLAAGAASAQQCATCNNGGGYQYGGAFTGCANGQCGAGGCANGQCGTQFYNNLRNARDAAHQYNGNPYGPGPYNCQAYTYPQPDLFYNFYAHGPCGGYPAQMYVAPKPVPANVGHTYITYQPFMPHEFMYKHHRTYHQYYDGGRGLTRAKVIAW